MFGDLSRGDEKQKLKICSFIKKKIPKPILEQLQGSVFGSIYFQFEINELFQVTYCILL